MRLRLASVLFLSAAMPAAAIAQMTSAVSTERLAYPDTERGDVVEEQFGVAVADPYRWLEADVRSDPKVRDSLAAENPVTER